MESARRQKLSYELQVRVFRRDGWLCRWCQRPVVFAPALKYLQRFIADGPNQGELAYYDERYRRDRAPLLDDRAAVVDHVQAHSRGGSDTEENFVTACNKCNMRKSAEAPDEFARREPPRPVKGRYGEPKHWDGLAAVFIRLAGGYSAELTASERGWLRALTAGMPALPSD